MSSPITIIHTGHAAHTVTIVGVPGPAGPPGPPGAGSGGAPLISADAANRLKPGSDGGLHVADTLSDPVAYYILAKS
ncbi:hypothetical protein EBQ26_10535 [Allofranklinella schreckenbergeri]|uniref:Uncharacterized protein n=1 Tax=Allofranklinella schreckenbergeri TaxID=1076744 RepID=A0A3M6QWZ3_9BURK|nr:hypothetical protein [Allofranklinella schreckenbergeri]RMW96034.1 hypothetical protein EBQ26_10535 [Allofranklinella schreckenbergeri]RMX07421.1 hypothetical protein EBQ24_08780 [Allofranklinella schreckenbergeri]